MNIEILVILFLVFGVISSLVSKFRDYQRRQETDRPNRPIPRPRTVYQPDEEEIDLSEWEVFQDDSPGTPQGEFQEVQGRSPVSVDLVGNEFQEVRGKRPVDENLRSEEFQKPRVDEPTKNPKRESTKVVKKRRGVNLAMSRKDLRRAIIYNEVIGPPRADNMPW
jgi:hypothetical protein